MKILNLYSGIGGNRKLWGDEHDITAVEINPQIARIYQDFFPRDKVIVVDAHQYLLDHFKEFEFIWSSPPCPSHSTLRKSLSMASGAKAIYPDMKLYEEILFLKGYFKGKWCVENVISWYEPLIPPQEIQRHYFWTNFHISDIEVSGDKITDGKRKEWENKLGFDIGKYKLNERKDRILRNCVNPYLGLHILNESKRDIHPELFR